ncbi:MAG: glycosyltransferase [Aggregatilineales bacterium]
MNLLWHSHSPSVPSGYGALTRAFTPRLKQAGHRLTISACYGGREGGFMRNRSGILELPRGADPSGNDIIRAHVRYAHAQVVLSLLDPSGFDPAVWGSFPWAAWLPMGGERLSDETLHILRAARWVIAMSRRDEQQLHAAGFRPLYVPPGIDINTYKMADRQMARAEMARFVDREVADSFVVMARLDNESATTGRLADLLQPFAQFARTHPDALLYLHPESCEAWDDEPILAFARSCGVGDKVVLPPHYPFACGLVNATLLNQLYNAADVFLHLSRQGTGLMTLEAQCAGCPVIAIDTSAEAELCAIGWRLAFLEAAPAALAAAYRLGGDSHRRALRRVAREKALLYDADRVMVFCLVPALARIERELPLSLPDPATSHSRKESTHEKIFA